MAKFLDLDGVAYLWSKIKALIPTYFVPATPTQEGIVTTDSQWLGGAKGARILSVARDEDGGGSIRFYRSNEGGAENLYVRMDNELWTDNQNTLNYFRIRCYKPDFTNGRQTSNYEEYYLPTVNDIDETSGNQTYAFLTTKYAVGVNEGGTGASTASAARTNLGLGVTTLYNTTFNSSSSAVTLTNAMNYSLLVFLGRPGDTINASLVVPTTGQITASDTNYQIAGQSNYFSIKLKSSGNNVIMTYNSTSNTSNGRITRIYGII